MRIQLTTKDGKEKSEELLRKVEAYERKQAFEEREARKKKLKTEQINVRMTRELYEKLEGRAHRERVSLGEMARKLIMQELKEE